MSKASTPIGYILQEESSVVKNMKIVAESGRRVTAEGILQTAEELNRNGRFYERKELFPELTGPRITELLSTGNLKGEDGHPSSKELTRQQTIDPMFTCVKYLKLWTKGDDIWATFRGDNTARGEYFDLDLRDGDLPSFSLRALGTIDNKGGKAYVRNVRVITWDRVYYPSHKRAYTKGIVSESGSLLSSKLAAPRGGINESGILTIDGSSNQLYETESSGIIAPVTNDSVINYIKTESANIHTIMNNFDIFYDTISLTEDGNSIQMVDKAGNTIIVSLEKYIFDEIMNYI
jgi:hypothetical protein